VLRDHRRSYPALGGGGGEGVGGGGGGRLGAGGMDVKRVQSIPYLGEKRGKISSRKGEG